LSPTSTASASSRLHAADRALFVGARARIPHPPRAVALARGYSALGEHAGGWLALGALGAALDRPRRRRWLRAAGVVGASYGISTSIKLLVRRRRPAVDGLPPLMATPTSLSFPSSHAVSSFAALRAYGALLPAPPLAVAAGAMALSRLYLGVHYPSDVAAGAALGTLIGSAAR